MDTVLQKMRESYQEAKQQQSSDKPRLQDITVNIKTGDFSFTWKDEK